MNRGLSIAFQTVAVAGLMTAGITAANKKLTDGYVFFKPAQHKASVYVPPAVQSTQMDKSFEIFDLDSETANTNTALKEVFETFDDASGFYYLYVGDDTYIAAISDGEPNNTLGNKVILSKMDNPAASYDAEQVRAFAMRKYGYSPSRDEFATDGKYRSGHTAIVVPIKFGPVDLNTPNLQVLRVPGTSSFVTADTRGKPQEVSVAYPDMRGSDFYTSFGLFNGAVVPESAFEQKQAVAPASINTLHL